MKLRIIKVKKRAGWWTVPKRKVTDLYGTNIYIVETTSNVKWKNANMAICNWFLNKIKA